MKKSILVLIGCAIVGFSALNLKFNKETTVVEVLQQLGEELPSHYLKMDTVLVKQGFDIVHQGYTTAPNGKLSKPISKYYSCTSCHNSIREDSIITQPDPDTRLTYLVRQKTPFLQASTFWGVVNRESWYNGDYVKKYGDLVKPANKSLRAAIQLCTVECAQGRPAEKWEEDAILSYFWSLQLKIKDLDLPTAVLEELQTAPLDKQNKSLVAKIKATYPLLSPATFLDPLKNKRKGYPVKGDRETGKMIYDASCKHCHGFEGVSRFVLDDDKDTFRFLKRKMFKNTNSSIYKIIRKGTYASPGARPYMPHFTKEKMSDRQIESLRTYIEFRSK